MSVKFDVAKCPVCGGGLEAAYEYGHTILRCPYCGFYTYVTITEGGKRFVADVPIILPKWTFHARQALNIVREELAQARKYLAKRDDESAYARLVWTKDSLWKMPREVQDLPIINKLLTSIGRAENYFLSAKRGEDEKENIRRFRDEVRDIYDVFIRSAPTVGGKRGRRKRI